MWRGSICITSCQHKLCQTQLLCWELTQGLRQQHRDQSAAAAQMQMKTIPGTGSTSTSPVHPCTLQKVPWLLICTAFNMVKWEMKEVSLCLQRQLQNSLGTLGKARYLRWSCIPNHAASPSSTWDIPTIRWLQSQKIRGFILSFFHSFTILFQAASSLFLFPDISSMTRKQRKQSGELKNSCTAVKYHLGHSCNQV